MCLPSKRKREMYKRYKKECNIFTPMNINVKEDEMGGVYSAHGETRIREGGGGSWTLDKLRCPGNMKTVVIRRREAALERSIGP
jgi:hypothetical protein